MPKGIQTHLSNIDKENIIKLYVDENVSLHELKKLYKISVNTIKKIVGNIRTKKESNLIGANKRPKKLTTEIKNKISLKLKSIHAEGKHPGWSHINSDNTRRSFPEKIFFSQLHKWGLTNTYTFVEKLPVGKYFLDFALIDMKIDIEIDGQQHFRNNDAIIHDQIRDEYLKTNGWKVYRIAYKEMQLNLKKVMIDLINWLNDFFNNSNRFYSIKEIKLKYIKHNKKTIEELEASYKKKQKFDISKDELEQLVKTNSLTSIGKMFNVSGNAIKKRCKKLGINLEKYYWQNNILSMPESPRENIATNDVQVG